MPDSSKNILAHPGSMDLNPKNMEICPKIHKSCRRRRCLLNLLLRITLQVKGLAMQAWFLTLEPLGSHPRTMKLTLRGESHHWKHVDSPSLSPPPHPPDFQRINLELWSLILGSRGPASVPTFNHVQPLESGLAPQAPAFAEHLQCEPPRLQLSHHSSRFISVTTTVFTFCICYSLTPSQWVLGGVVHYMFLCKKLHYNLNLITN